MWQKWTEQQWRICNQNEKNETWSWTYSLAQYSLLHINDSTAKEGIIFDYIVATVYISMSAMKEDILFVAFIQQIRLKYIAQDYMLYNEAKRLRMAVRALWRSEAHNAMPWSGTVLLSSTMHYKRVGEGLGAIDYAMKHDSFIIQEDVYCILDNISILFNWVKSIKYTSSSMWKRCMLFQVMYISCVSTMNIFYPVFIILMEPGSFGRQSCS